MPIVHIITIHITYVCKENRIIKANRNLVMQINRTRSIKCFIYFIDSTCVVFGGRVFQQTIGVPMGKKYTPLLTDLFLHADQADFLQTLLKNKDRELFHTFNLSLSNCRCGDYLHCI